MQKILDLLWENPKTLVTLGAGALVTLTVWILSFWGITVSTEVCMALGTVFGILIAHFTRVNKTEAKLLKLTTTEDQNTIIKAKEQE